MIAIKLKNKKPAETLRPYQENYSYAFRKIYSNPCVGKSYIQKKYGLDSWEYASLLEDMKSKRKQVETINNKKLCRIKTLEKEPQKQKKISSKEIYKKKRKISFLKKSIEKGITFGSKRLLGKISRAKNSGDEEIYEESLRDYRAGRILPIYVIGESLEKGNRKFDFDLKNNFIIYKPRKGVKIPIEFHCGKKQRKNLHKLQEMSDSREITITIHLSEEFVCLSYDEEKLAGYHLRKNEAKRKAKETGDWKSVFREAHIEHDKLRLVGKIASRYMAVDLNPQQIGLSILDGEKIIATEQYDLSNLSAKLKLSSSDPIQIKQNNKRKFEISNVWAKIFKLAMHYKVGHFVVEKLNFKKEETKAKEANRKTRNIWHRTLTTQLITKHCKINGIDLIEVNPAYSSFIGNVKHNFSDPINASLEVCRRGINKFKKSGFYPELSRIDCDAMRALVLNQCGDVRDKNIEKFEAVSKLTWKSYYVFFKETGLKYRCDLDLNRIKSFSFSSHKSGILRHSY